MPVLDRLQSRVTDVDEFLETQAMPTGWSAPLVQELVAVRRDDDPLDALRAANAMCSP